MITIISVVPIPNIAPLLKTGSKKPPAVKRRRPMLTNRGCWQHQGRPVREDARQRLESEDHVILSGASSGIKQSCRRFRSWSRQTSRVGRGASSCPQNSGESCYRKLAKLSRNHPCRSRSSPSPLSNVGIATSAAFAVGGATSLWTTPISNSWKSRGGNSDRSFATKKSPLRVTMDVAGNSSTSARTVPASSCRKTGFAGFIRSSALTRSRWSAGCSRCSSSRTKSKPCSRSGGRVLRPPPTRGGEVSEYLRDVRANAAERGLAEEPGWAPSIKPGEVLNNWKRADCV